MKKQILFSILLSNILSNAAQRRPLPPIPKIHGFRILNKTHNRIIPHYRVKDDITKAYDSDSFKEKNEVIIIAPNKFTTLTSHNTKHSPIVQIESIYVIDEKGNQSDKIRNPTFGLYEAKLSDQGKLRLEKRK